MVDFKFSKGQPQQEHARQISQLGQYKDSTKLHCDRGRNPHESNYVQRSAIRLQLIIMSYNSPQQTVVPLGSSAQPGGGIAATRPEIATTKATTAA